MKSAFNSNTNTPRTVYHEEHEGHEENRETARKKAISRERTQGTQRKKGTQRAMLFFEISAFFCGEPEQFLNRNGWLSE
jgi:hypothetical protein